MLRNNPSDYFLLNSIQTPTKKAINSKQKNKRFFLNTDFFTTSVDFKSPSKM